MKTRYKILIPIAIIIALLFILMYPFFFGYFPFPWSNINDPYCHSYFHAHHDHPTPNSVMNWYCASTYSALQSVDDTAIDIHYP